MKLVVKPYKSQEKLNNQLTTLAVLNQVIIEKFDEVADNTEVWNQRFKNIGKQNVKNLEELQKKIYNQHYEENQTTFQYAEESVNRLIELLTKCTVDEYIDLMGFLEILRYDRAKGTTLTRDFLIEKTELINQQLAG